MSRDLEYLIAKVDKITQDTGFSTDDITDALNNAMNIIAGGIQRPDSSMLTSPLPMLYSISTVTALTTTYKVVMPSDYQRDMVLVIDSDGREITLFDSFMDFMRTYPGLDESGTSVSGVAIKGGYLYYQPIPTVAEVLTVHYHRLPVDMVATTDVPDGIPVQYYDLLVYHAIKEFFATIEDGLDGAMPNSDKWDNKLMQMLMRMEASIPNDGGIISL